MAEEPNPDTSRPAVLGGAALFYTGRAPNQRRSDKLPAPVRLALDVPSLYDPPAELIAAVNVALTLRLPLLLTGPPGTGKTELARSLAMQLHDGGVDRLYAVTVTSTSDKADVLYRYDELARLRDAYDRTPGRLRTPDQAYLSLRGLGAAIAAAAGPMAALQPIVPGRALAPDLKHFEDLLHAAPGETTSPDPIPLAKSAAFFLPPGAPPPVVLIDEIDKAPRELPNDLLTELDRMRFDIPELGVRVVLPDGAAWPVVIITSNAERPLPDAFLRRCVCFHVDPPEGDMLRRIIDAKLRALSLLDGAEALPSDLVDFVQRLRALPSIPEPEKPGTARVLDFAVLLADPTRFGGRGLRDLPEASLRAALTALLPSRSAQDAAFAAWATWRIPASSSR